MVVWRGEICPLPGYHQLVVAVACCLLTTNLSTATTLVLAMAWSRGGYAVGHLYLGMGLPSVLRVSLGMIETVSTLFRACSLSLRTLCNTVAGHVLLAVLAEMLLGLWARVAVCCPSSSSACIPHVEYILDVHHM